MEEVQGVVGPGGSHAGCLPLWRVNLLPVWDVSSNLLLYSAGAAEWLSCPLRPLGACCSMHCPMVLTQGVLVLAAGMCHVCRRVYVSNRCENRLVPA
jgi:hypothetical protein